MTTLEAESTCYLKKWVGLARSANPALLYLPKAKGGTGLPSLVTLWKKQQVSRACQLISSQYPVVRHAATQLTIKEEKSSRVKFTPMVAASDAMTVDPGMVRKKLTKVATTIIAEDDSEERFSAMVSSERQTGGSASSRGGGCSPMGFCSWVFDSFRAKVCPECLSGHSPPQL